MSELEEGPKNAIISAALYSAIRIWNIEHALTIRCLKLIDSHRLVSGSSERTIKIWNLDSTMKFWDFESSQCLNRIQVHEENLVSLLLTNNDEIITLSDESEVKVWSKEV